MHHCWHVDGHALQLVGWKALYLQRADLQSICEKSSHQYHCLPQLKTTPLGILSGEDHARNGV